MMADDTHYQMYKLLNREFTFDVDVSNLPCGLNGALYFVSMDADGGVSKHPNKKAGAKYGVGSCDSQCPLDLKFIQGRANVEGWTPSSNNKNTGLGNHGSCCAELDIWESNTMSQTLGPIHVIPPPTPCAMVMLAAAHIAVTGMPAPASTCDPDGCDFNPYRMGNHTFYGPGKTIDTNSPFTVVTQFITDNGTDTGTLSEIRRYYVQNGVVYAQPNSNVSGISGNAITPAYCTAENSVFDGPGTFAKHGGFAKMSEAMSGGMVLVMSLWDDYYADILWLDSTYPTNASSTPGAVRGSCSTDSGVPATLEFQNANSYVTYSNIKVGPIGSTSSSGSGSGGSGSGGSGSGSGGSTSTSTTSSPGSTSTTVAQHYGQCGGQGWTGLTTCASPYTCQVLNPYYSQCL